MYALCGLQACAVVLAKWAMTDAGLDTAAGNGADQALDRIEQAIGRLEAAIAARAIPPVDTAQALGTAQPPDAAGSGDLAVRHRRLKEKVTHELRQLDLLLANLPQ